MGNEQTVRVTCDSIKEYGKEIQKLGLLLQDENSTIYDIAEQAGKVGLTVVFGIQQKVE